MTGYAFVLDASAAMALIFSEGGGTAVRREMALAIESGLRVLVPALFWFEAANAVASAVRRGRLDGEHAEDVLQDLALLPLDTDQSVLSERAPEFAKMALLEGLSAYDSAYLELALRSELKLVTLDKKLHAAYRNRN